MMWAPVQAPAVFQNAYPGTKSYQQEVKDGRLTVLVGREPVVKKNGDRVILWHLSISHVSGSLAPNRYPTWDELKDARENFIPDEITVAMLLPPKAEYVNLHETTFHLWEI